MRTYGIVLKGILQIESLAVATPPTFNASNDRGRLIQLTTGAVYVGAQSDWKRVDSARSHDSGTVAPTETTAGMLFFNTSNLTLYMRNAANSAWVALYTETRPPVDSRGGGSFSADTIGNSTIGFGHESAFAATLDTATTNVLSLRSPSGSLRTALSVAYSSSAANVDTLGGYHIGSFARRSSFGSQQSNGYYTWQRPVYRRAGEPTTGVVYVNYNNG